MRARKLGLMSISGSGLQKQSLCFVWFGFVVCFLFLGCNQLKSTKPRTPCFENGREPGSWAIVATITLLRMLQCCPYSGQSQVVMVKILIQDSGDDYWHFNKCYNVTSNPLWQNEAVVWKSYMDDLLWFCVNLCMHIILRWPIEITSLTKCWIAVRLVDFQKALWKKINLKM